jgi:hypothetical protein
VRWDDGGKARINAKALVREDRIQFEPR